MCVSVRVASLFGRQFDHTDRGLGPHEIRQPQSLVANESKSDGGADTRQRSASVTVASRQQTPPTSGDSRPRRPCEPGPGRPRCPPARNQPTGLRRNARWAVHLPQPQGDSTHHRTAPIVYSNNSKPVVATVVSQLRSHTCGSFSVLQLRPLRPAYLAEQSRQPTLCSRQLYCNPRATVCRSHCRDPFRPCHRDPGPGSARRVAQILPLRKTGPRVLQHSVSSHQLKLFQCFVVSF